MRALLFAVVLALPLPALAQSDATRSAARELGTEGVEDFQEGKFSSAADKLDRAFKVVRAPSIGLWSARALVKTGKWVEAAERYLEVTRLDARTGDVAVQQQAQKDAVKEREELMARVPALRLELKSASSEVELKIDGAIVPSALVGAKLPVNPGSHAVEARDGGRVVKTQVNAAEGQLVPVQLDFAGVASAPTPAPANTAPPPVTPAATPESTDPGASQGRRVPATTWVALGLGAAGVAVGAATGILAKGKGDELSSSSCVDNRCDPAVRDKVDSYNGLRTISTIGFIAGGVGLAAGGILFLTAPRESQKASRIVPWLGLASAGVNGSF